MAGSWGHATNRDGTPREGEHGMGDLLENGGDVNEAVEEMYGMTWYLARSLEAVHRSPVTREGVLAQIEQAHASYAQGVSRGTEMQ